jgi:hypothetical protein
MKAIALVYQPRMMRPDVAEDYVGGPEALKRMVAAKLVAPKVKRKGLTLYDRIQLDLACDRIESLFPDSEVSEA